MALLNPEDSLSAGDRGDLRYSKRTSKVLVKGASMYDVEKDRGAANHDQLIDAHLWKCMVSGLSIIDLVNAARNIALDQAHKDRHSVKRWVSKSPGGDTPPARAKIALAAAKLDPDYPVMSKEDKKWDGNFPIPEDEREDVVESVIQEWKKTGFGDISLPVEDAPPCARADFSFDADSPDPADFPDTPQGYADYTRKVDQYKLDNARARKVCHSCPVRTECLAISFTRHKKKHDGTLNLNSVSMDKNGIWGGHTPRERGPAYKMFKKRFTDGVRSGEFDIPNTSAKQDERTYGG